jgi:hypothetical protein
MPELFRLSVSLSGMLESLSGKLMRREVVTFSMSGCGSQVSVRSQIVEFGNAVVRTLCHRSPKFYFVAVHSITTRYNRF